MPTEHHFCGCCHDSVITLYNIPLADRIRLAPCEGMRDIVQCESEKVDDLPAAGKELYQRCREYLSVRYDSADEDDAWIRVCPGDFENPREFGL